MNRVFAATWISVGCVLALSGCTPHSNQQVITEDMTVDGMEETVDAANDLITDDLATHRVKGSCNVIGEKSTCVDFTGDSWDEQRMRLQCSGVGEFSLNACPHTTIGGCIASVDTLLEQIVWMYETGGSPVTQEDAPYAAMACNATPSGQWTTPDQELERIKK